MRKQVLLGMMMFAMGASLIGCGKSDGKTDNATTTITSENQVVNESSENKTAAKADMSDWVKCSIDPKGSVKYPKYYLATTNIGTFLYNSNKSKDGKIPYFVVVEGGYEKELKEDTFDDVFSNLLNHIGSTYYLSFVNTSSDLLKDVKVECVKKETCKINGHDAYRYTAKTTGAANNKECYIYGYLSSTPRSSFTIYGIITDESQLQSDALKKEIQTEVDAIMNTFETK